MESDENRLVRVPRAEWDKIPRDYRGNWGNPDRPEYVGKKTVLAGCIVSGGGAGLLVEGVHFVIE